jgi:hypothetical protein
MASWPGRSRARWQSSGQLRGGCSRVSVGHALASAVSVTLLLLGITPVASRELREVVRTASAQGSVITLSQIHEFCAEEQFGSRWETQHDGSSHAPLPHDVTAVNLPGI